MNRNGKQRWQMIKAGARRGPVEAFRRWREAARRSEIIVEFNAPDVIVEHFNQIAHDRAVSVRMSVPALPIDEHRKWTAKTRNTLAEQGTEYSPQELVDVHDEAIGELRKSLEAKGYPMPTNNLAARELLFAIMRGA